VPAAPPTPAPPAAPAAPPTLRRSELDAALADFARLSRDVTVDLSILGATLTHVAPDSLLHRLGLRTGDRVLSVDGRPLRTLDDAAALYARLPRLAAISVELQRGTDRVTLRVPVTK
jgi:S1-C subfamily serine protease